MREIRIPDSEVELNAAKNMDWQQVRLNGAYGAPCFHLEPEGRFCGRAHGWHNATTDRMFHKFTPLALFVERIAKAEQERDEALTRHVRFMVAVVMAADYDKLKAELSQARAAAEAMGRPVSDDEWGVCNVPSFKEIDALHRKMADALIAARLDRGGKESER